MLVQCGLRRYVGGFLYFTWFLLCYYVCLLKHVKVTCLQLLWDALWIQNKVLIKQHCIFTELIAVIFTWLSCLSFQTKFEIKKIPFVFKALSNVLSFLKLSSYELSIRALLHSCRLVSPRSAHSLKCFSCLFIMFIPFNTDDAILHVQSADRRSGWYYKILPVTQQRWTAV